MKKIKKILLVLVILVLVLGLAAVVFVGLFFDDIAKKGIETVAPTITQTSVTVDSVHVSLLSGSAGINGLIIGNPAGFQTTNAISLGKASVSISPGSLLGDKIVIHSVQVIAPQITFEGNPFGLNNLQKILDNVSGTPQTNQPAATPAASKGAAKKLEVDDFLISGAQVTAHLTSLGNQSFTVPIPDIHFSNLGTGPDGITAADLTKKILTEIITDSVQSVATHAKDLVGGSLKGIQNGGTSALKGLGNMFGK